MLWRVALIFALSLALSAAGQQNKRLTPATHRHAASDLEVLVVDSNGKPAPSIFLSRAYLSNLPQTTSRLHADENFPEIPTSGVRVSGVDLNTFVRAVAPSDLTTAVIAICRDEYTAPFPPQTIKDQHPILVLTMDGLSPHAWAARHHTYDPSPYFVTYQNFVPSFHILAHQDRAQYPAEILSLKLIPAASLFAAITPPDSAQLPSDSPVLDGFRIAQQNCFRCHNSGGTGGTKSHQTWQHLGEVAKERPEFFAAWTQNPQSLDPKAKMPPNLKYDQATLKALTRYFQTFAPAK
jgi:mono/diheme cytochrome c family protein